jgi:hypothetical protein
MNYYHILNLSFTKPNVDSVWLQKTGISRFCLRCGERKENGVPIDIEIDGRHLPLLTGAFGYPNVGFAASKLISALEPEFSEALVLGTIINCEGEILFGVNTFSTRTRVVPVRGYKKIDTERCTACGKVSITGGPLRKRYVVSHGDLTKPIYESSDSQLILCEDMFSRVQRILNNSVIVESLPIYRNGFDGCEVQEAIFDDI